MSIKHKPTAQTQSALESLQKAVNETLLRKQQLGQYSVVWNGTKPVHEKAHSQLEK